MDKSLIEQMTNESQHFSDDLTKTIKEVIRDSMNLEVLRKKLPQSAVDNLDPKALLAIVAYAHTTAGMEVIGETIMPEKYAKLRSLMYCSITEILCKFNELATHLQNKEKQGDE